MVASDRNRIITAPGALGMGSAGRMDTGVGDFLESSIRTNRVKVGHPNQIVNMKLTIASTRGLDMLLLRIPIKLVGSGSYTEVWD